MHDVAGDEPGLGGEKKDAGIGDGVAFRAIAERMDVIEVLGYARGVGLVRGPLPEHGGPGARRANCVHADAVFGVIQRH